MSADVVLTEYNMQRIVAKYTMMRKKSFKWLLGALPMILLVPIQQKASWRPHILSPGHHSVQPGWNKLGHWLGSSSRLFFFFEFGSIDEQEGGPESPYPVHFHVLDLNGRVREAKTQIRVRIPELCFISEDEAVIWNEDYINRKKLELRGQIFDCQKMEPIRLFEPVELMEDKSNFGAPRVGFPSKRGVIYASELEVFEWNIITGDVLHHWKRRPPAEGGMVGTTYASKSDTILQVNQGHLQALDAKSGRLLRETPRLAGFKENLGDESGPGSIKFSPNGELFVYDTPEYGDPEGPLHIGRCSDGKTLWTVPNESGTGGNDGLDEVPFHGAAFSTDCSQLFLWNEAARAFSVHDSYSGKILQCLDGPPDVNNFWLSPDNAWLYSFDKHGNLWRQRAR